MRALSYAAVLAGSAVLSLLLTPWALRVALRRGFLDRPGGHKTHRHPVPNLGGVAIIGAFTVATVAAISISPPPARVGEALTILGLGMALGLLGFVDDVRGVPPPVRLAVEAAAAVVLFVGAEGALLFDSDLLNLLVTILWVVVITNGFNLLDNMDGLAAGVAVIAAGWFFVIAALNGQYLVASLAVALAGCALGFLRHNRHPARIFMGDAGSLFLGFTIAATGIKLRFDGPREVTFFVPALVLGIAVLDTTLVVVSRLARRRSPFQGGQDHLSHRLVRLGLRPPVAVAAIHATALVLGGLALVLSRLGRTPGLWSITVAVAAGLAVVAWLSAVPADDEVPGRP